MAVRRTSAGNVQRVTIKSVNVTAMVPKGKEAFSDHLKAKYDITDGTNHPMKHCNSHTEAGVVETRPPTIEEDKIIT